MTRVLPRFLQTGVTAGVTLLAALSPAVGQAQPPAAAMAIYEQVLLTAGRSTIVTTDFDVTRIAVTNPEVADAVVVQPREILVDGRGPGTVSLIVWGAGTRVQYDVVVARGVSVLQQQLAALFPGEDIRVSLSDEAIVLHGHVSSNTVMLRAAEIAQAVSSESDVINMLQLPGGSGSQQVMLQVRFAEINKRALTELGASLFSTRGNTVARGTTQQFAAPDFDDSADGGVAGMVFSDFLNLFFFNRKEGIGGVVKALQESYFNRKEGIGGVVKALQETGYFQSLAEPNLIAYNGQEASFLAGGEFPIPVVQGVTNAVSIVFKEFGVRLSFTPTIAGDVIRLKVRPEVSSLDFNNGITLGGFRIPGLITRRAETDVELRDGQTFAIAGLLNNLAQNDSAAVPILSKIPIIGALFKSQADRKEQTELMVLITPRLVEPLDPDEVPPLPTMGGRFLPSGEGLGAELQGGGGDLDAPHAP